MFPLTVINKVLPIALFILSLVYAYVGLMKSSYALGWDSYFYINQVQSWYDSGHLHAQRLNVIYPLLIGIQFFLNDYELSYKVLTIIALASFVSTSYLLVKQQKPTVYALMLALVVWSNPQLIYFSSQFTKNLIAFSFFNVFLIALKQDQKVKAFFICLFLLFSHKLMFGCGLLYAIYYYSYTFVRKHFYLRLFSLIAPCALFSMLCFFLKKDVLGKWHVPSFSFLTTHAQVLSTHWKVFIIASLLLVLWIIVRLCSKQGKVSKQSYALVGVFLFLNNPWLRWDSLAYSYRFQMVFLIFAPLLLVELNLKKRIQFVFVPLFFLSLWSSVTTYSPQKHDPPYLKYTFISLKLAQTPSFGATRLMICHKSLAEFLSFKLKKDVLPWGVEEKEWKNNTTRLMYLPLDGKKECLALIKQIKHSMVANEYVLLDEYDFQQDVIKKASPRVKNLLTTWRNPMTIR